ncbi:MAG TPA: glycerol-3-phosphate dehydrogenase/oxidase, partial [Thermoanaerobaculia bacterium]|nr:glycerol-3-phosphate dehydrogenase/oxidase [Thermoanaerobaculia bacterium]
RHWDLLVVGGGASGAAVARDAALRGLAVALVERHDLAFGASSRSSRLIHGGLRYLAHGDLALVREGLVERGRLLATAAGLVRPVRFLYPVYAGDPDPLWRVDLGLHLYDLLAAGHSLGRHRRLSADEAAAVAPGLRRDGLRGAAVYGDAACHDARLVVALARSASAAGAIVVTRCKAERPGSGGLVAIEDTVSARGLTVRARAVVLCCGPWSDLLAGGPVRLRTTRGAHLAFPRARLPLACHVALRSPDDGRLAFAMPAGEHTVVGTTDEDDGTPPDAVRATPDDVAYLLRVARHAFPDAALAPADVSGVWAGLRSLVARRSRDGRVHPSAVSRRHVVARAGPGLWVLAGGKLTSHRRMAEDCLDAVLRELRPRLERAPGPCVTHRVPLATEEQGGNAELETLVTRAADEEWALALDDLLLRRLEPGPLDYAACLAAAPRAAALLGERLGWSEGERQAQVGAFAALVEGELAAAGLPYLSSFST